MIDLTPEEANALASVLRELGHPEGTYGDQHLLTAACKAISERTMIPTKTIVDALFTAIVKIHAFIDQESPNQSKRAKRKAH